MIELKRIPVSLMPTYGFGINDRTEISKKASLLMDIAKCVSMHGTADGEDSSGRSIVRSLTVEEIVVKSVEIVDALLLVCQNRQWIAEKGSIEEMYEELPQKTGFR